ncbi:carboxypeptidase regulatory-like domain-containing protein, partial [bacterium]|nr:carboxypeptidase regulatory-like domain-containing protein [bacterium]
SYTLHIECEGYVPVDTAVEVVDSDVSLEIPLYLVKYTVSGWVELSDRPAGEWAGTEVTLGDRSTATDSVGYFEFDDVLPGTYPFSASHGEGYVPFETTLTVDEDVSLTITLEHIPVDSGNVLVLVSLEGGGALNGTRVVLVELGDTAYTNPMGRARLRGVPYGTYTLEVSRENYQTYTQELVVDAPAETVNVMLYLKRGIVEGFVYLSDTVLDLSGSIVVLDGSDTAETDITGYFGFSNVAYGEHTLHFEHGEDYVPYDTTVTLTDPGTVFVSVTLEYAGVALNPPRNVNVISGYHNRVAVRWDPPEPTSANLLGYGVIRSSFSGIDTIAYVPYWCTGYIDYDGVTGLFSVFAVYEEGNSDAVGYLVGWPGDNPDAPDVLILDFDNGALLADNGTSDEALALRDLLWTGQVSCQVTDQDQDIDDFELLYYRAVFVVTGISDDDNTLIPDESLIKLFDYLAAGGRVYWEGADVAADYATMYDSTFGYIFGAFMADDGRPASGMGNVATLYGQPPYFEDGVTFDYQHSSPADHYVDEFYATSTSSPMLYSQGGNPPPAVNGLRMVANDFDMAEFSDYTSRWKDVVSSVYLGAIDYRDDNSNAYEVLRSVWRFLFDEELPAGVEESEAKVPVALAMTLSPTPFNSSLEIALDVPVSVSGELKITDITGKTVAKLYEGELKPGVVKFRWDADELTPSGTYLVVFSSGDGQKIVRKAVLLR